MTAFASLTNAVLTLDNKLRSDTSSIEGLESQEVHGLFTAIRRSSGVVTLDDLDGTYFADTSVVGTVNLPTAVGVGGRIYIIVDETGNATANNITILPNGIETISGAASLVLNTNFSVARLQSNGINWFII